MTTKASDTLPPDPLSPTCLEKKEAIIQRSILEKQQQQAEADCAKWANTAELRAVEAALKTGSLSSCMEAIKKLQGFLAAGGGAGSETIHRLALGALLVVLYEAVKAQQAAMSRAAKAADLLAGPSSDNSRPMHTDAGMEHMYDFRELYLSELLSHLYLALQEELAINLQVTSCEPS